VGSVGWGQLLGEAGPGPCRRLLLGLPVTRAAEGGAGRGEAGWGLQAQARRLPRGRPGRGGARWGGWDGGWVGWGWVGTGGGGVKGTGGGGVGWRGWGVGWGWWGWWRYSSAASTHPPCVHHATMPPCPHAAIPPPIPPRIPPSHHAPGPYASCLHPIRSNPCPAPPHNPPPSSLPGSGAAGLLGQDHYGFGDGPNVLVMSSTFSK
jgi:hypothetical protein